MKKVKRNYWFMGLNKGFRNRFIKKEEVEATAVAKKRTTTVTSKRKTKAKKSKTK